MERYFGYLPEKEWQKLVSWRMNPLRLLERGYGKHPDIP
jgi:hypothetical protein